MANCLITKLKGSVNNPDLKIFDWVIIDTPSAVTRTILIAPATGKKCYLKKGDVVTEYSAPVELTLDANSRYLVGNWNTVGIIDTMMMDLYDISDEAILLRNHRFSDCSSLIKISISKAFSYKELPNSLTHINIYQGKDCENNRDGFVSKLQSLSNLVNFGYLYNTDGYYFTTSEIAAFGNYGLTTISMINNTARGRFEDFVVARRNANQASGQLNFGSEFHNNTLLTFGEQATGNLSGKSLTWVANAYDNTRTDITLDGVTETIDASGNIVG